MMLRSIIGTKIEYVYFKLKKNFEASGERGGSPPR